MKRLDINWDLPDEIISWIWGNDLIKLRRKKPIGRWVDFFTNNRKYHNINRVNRKNEGFKKLVVNEIRKRNEYIRNGFQFQNNNRLHIEDRILLLDFNEKLFTKINGTKIGYHIKKLKYQNPEYFIFKKHKDGYNIWRINAKI